MGFCNIAAGIILGSSQARKICSKFGLSTVTIRQFMAIEWLYSPCIPAFFDQHRRIILATSGGVVGEMGGRSSRNYLHG